jgi:(E)-4-hydroxy-3-methylbut-2-enyl-diphosphate synthase
MKRRETSQVKVGNILVGGDAPISVQSMLNRPAGDIKGSVAQAKELENVGCDIIRAAVPTVEDVALIRL